MYLSIRYVSKSVQRRPEQGVKSSGTEEDNCELTNVGFGN